MQNFKSLFGKYMNEFSREQERLRQLAGFLQDTAAHQLTDRGNTVGHITASGIIINLDRTKILLIPHPYLGRWLQPGGHINPEDHTLLQAAFREIKEEVGISEEDLQLISPLPDRHVPIDIDTQSIPANPKKQEGQHFHHDFRYLMVYQKSDEKLTLNGAEAKEYKWVPFSDLDVQKTFIHLLEKLRMVELSE